MWTRAYSALLAGTVAIAACSDATGIGPENQLEVDTATDNFEFQVSDLVGVSEDLSYTWQNTGSQAVVDVSQAVTGGAALLTIRDAEGTIVYEADIGDDSDGDTTEGVAGDWTIELELEESSGTFNFRVQRKT